MEKLKVVLTTIFNNFGPILVFYMANHFFGLKPAIASSTIFSIGEISYKHYMKQVIGNLLKFTVVMTLIFGMIDLYAQHSFLFKYEPSITNLFTAIFFLSTVFSEKTIIQEFYEKKEDSKPMTLDRVAYFKILTIVWVLYFVLKSVAYFWMAQKYSIEQGMMIRMVLGSASFYVLLGISIFGSKYIFPRLKALGVLPAVES